MNPSCSGSLSESDGDSLGTSFQNNSTSKREVKLTSEWLKDRWIVENPPSPLLQHLRLRAASPRGHRPHSEESRSASFCRTGAFGRDAEGLEHGFLAHAASCQRSPERRLSAAACKHSIGEIVWDESMVLGRQGLGFEGFRVKYVLLLKPWLVLQ